jgi:hypothetical protein
MMTATERLMMAFRSICTIATMMAMGMVTQMYLSRLANLQWDTSETTRIAMTTGPKMAL